MRAVGAGGIAPGGRPVYPKSGLGEHVCAATGRIYNAHSDL